MKKADKLNKLITLLGASQSDSALLEIYLDQAGDEIMNWLYSSTNEDPSEYPFPEKYDWVQINACITGFNLSGGENETHHSENGITRDFKYSDMLDYIHAHVYPYVGIPYESSES